jgi:hypothetical protein
VFSKVPALGAEKQVAVAKHQGLVAEVRWVASRRLWRDKAGGLDVFIRDKLRQRVIVLVDVRSGCRVAGLCRI